MEKRVVVVTAKRKTSIARGVVREGSGIVRINGYRVEVYGDELVRLFIMEPLIIAAKVLGEDKLNSVNIYVTVNGGGFMSQAAAARSAIAKGLVERFKDEALANAFRDYDRYLLVDDARRKEPKKFGGPGARARFQKSYR